jgi:N-acyl amino acid synthase of PEP-CTERM/exosortase system
METAYFRFMEIVPGTSAYEHYLEFRYEIFCTELQRITPSTCLLSSNGRPMETDQYDSYSRHFMAYHKATGSLAASARVILPNPNGLNVTPRYIIEYPLPYSDADNDNIGEISRMAISPQFRRRHEDKGKPFQGDPGLEMGCQSEASRKRQPELVLGIYREIYLLCQQENIRYCMAAMDSRFGRLLNTLGFPFVPVGPVNENVLPPRRVYLISALEMERSLSQRGSGTLNFLQDADTVVPSTNSAI